MNDVKTSYLFWLFGLFGAAGVHRLYNKKIFTGLLWMFTGGLLGIGQLVDLLLIPDMVDEHNAKARMRLGMSPYGTPIQPAVTAVVTNSTVMTPPKLTREQLMLKLLKAAHEHGGKLSVTQAVLATECSFAEVEATLQAMVKTGYVAIENHPETGVVLYDFVEL
jgi:TM2 domain-containing membrane protein YozV